MGDQGSTKAVENKIDEPEKSGAAQTGAKPNESEQQARERQEREAQQKK